MMMRTLHKQTYEDIIDRDSHAVFEDAEFTRCTFRNCVLSMAHKPDARARISRVTLRNCTVDHCQVFSPMLREIVIDSVRTGSAPLFTRGAVFDQVTLTGTLDSIVVTPHPDFVGFPDADRAAFAKENADFYAQVEWALDIRDVRANELEIYGVPAQLIRRDPETQAVVRRENAVETDRWQQLDLRNTWWKPAINKLLLHDYDEVVLATPLRNRRAEAFVDGIKLLRSAGVADPG